MVANAYVLSYSLTSAFENVAGDQKAKIDSWWSEVDEVNNHLDVLEVNTTKLENQPAPADVDAVHKQKIECQVISLWSNVMRVFIMFVFGHHCSQGQSFWTKCVETFVPRAPTACKGKC